jgi:hypothetical protein
MRISTAHNHYRRLRSRTRDIMSCPYLSHQEQLARMAERVWHDPGLARCPSWVVSILRECALTTQEANYQYALVWCHEWEGTRYHSWDEIPVDARQDWQEGNSYHYWRQTGRRFG